MNMKCLTQYMDHRNHFLNNMTLVLIVSFVTCCYIIAVVQLLSRVQFCDPMDCSTPGFPVLYYLLEFAQIYVQGVSDAV